MNNLSVVGLLETVSYIHDKTCNQKYNKTLPYSFHLECCYQQAIKFNRYIPQGKRTTYLAAVICHDLIEDARLTYNDIIELILKEDYIPKEDSTLIADAVYACTEYRGRNRAERHPEQYYIDIANDPIALFAKTCDLLANITFSILTTSSMFYKYQKEFQQEKMQHVITALEKIYPDMLVQLTSLLKLK